MRMLVRPSALALTPLIVLAAVPELMRAQSVSHDDATGVFTIDWAAPQGTSTKPFVGSSEAVSLELRNFNYVRYDVTVETTVDTVEALVRLNDLLGEAIGLAGAVGVGAGLSSSAKYKSKEDLWQLEMAGTRFRLESVIEGLTTQVALSTSDQQYLADSIPEFEDALARIRTARGDAFGEVQDVDDLVAFNATNLIHEEVVSLVTRFLTRARAATRGVRRALPKPVPGTIVSATVTAAAAGGREASRSFEYVVKTDRRLNFHLGPALARVSDASFESVATSFGTDYFAKIREADQQEDLVVFGTYGFDVGPVLVGPTLGVSVTSPDESLYLGASLALGPAFLTVGGASVEVAQGGNAVVETIGGVAGARTLFQSFSRQREWAFFAAVSFALSR